MTIFGGKQPSGPGSLGGGVPDTAATPGGVIDHDLPCTQCGYNLRGLTSGMNCPKCAAPVARSAHGRWLRFANAEWLNQLRRGVLLKLWSMLVALVVSFGAAALVFKGFPKGLVSAVGVVGSALATYGAFFLTSSEPNVTTSEKSVSLRRVFRWLALIGLGVALLKLAWQPSGRSLFAVIFIILKGLGSVVSLAMMFCELVYLRRFARRIPDDVLAKCTSTLMWSLVVVLVLNAELAILGKGLFRFGAIPDMGAGFGFSAGGRSVDLLLLALVVFYLLLLFRYLRAFREARDFSLAMGRSAPQAT